MQYYRVAGPMGEGTFSEVLKCQSLKDGNLYACKKMKQKYDTIEQVNNLREIQALRRLNPHTNIINLKEVIFDRQTGSLALICELMDMNIYELIKDRRSYFPESKVKLYMYQLCKAIYHMHRNGIFHRDVKPENILIKENVLKLADFGSCKSVYSKYPYTEYISTRWYRAPECLLTDGHYDHRMDMWSVGCVMCELISLVPLFPGTNELDQIAKIHEIVGSPSPAVLQKFRRHQSRHMEFNFPHTYGKGIRSQLKYASKACIDIITQLCAYDPDERITAKQALRHPFFQELREAERHAKQVVVSPSVISSKGYASRQSRGIELIRAAKEPRRRPGKKHKLPHVLPEFQIPKCLTDTSLGRPQGLAETNNFKFPHITPHHGYTSGLRSGLHTQAPSKKGTDVGSFLPALYTDNTAKHPLYPSVTRRHPHQSHRRLSNSFHTHMQGRDPV